MMKEKGVHVIVGKGFYAKMEQSRREHSKYIPIKGIRQLTDLWAADPKFKFPQLNMRRRYVIKKR